MSSINTNNIDKQFPQPGVDNDSFGFRNNFSEIANNLDLAKQEINDLQENVVRTDVNNDLNGQRIEDVNFTKHTEQVYDLGNIDTNAVIDFNNGSYQTVDVSSDLTLTLAGWPTADRKANIEVALTGDGSQRTITWDVENDGVLKYNQGIPVELYDSTDISTVTIGGWPENFVVNSASNPILVEFYSIDGGDTVYATYKGQFV